MVEKSQDIEMDKSVAVGNVENNSENGPFNPGQNLCPGQFQYCHGQKIFSELFSSFPTATDLSISLS